MTENDFPRFFIYDYALRPVKMILTPEGEQVSEGDSTANGSSLFPRCVG
jgi:hypothetical protein